MPGNGYLLCRRRRNEQGFMCPEKGICIAGAEETGRYLREKNLLCGYRGSRLLCDGKGIGSAAAKTGSRLLAAG